MNNDCALRERKSPPMTRPRSLALSLPCLALLASAPALAELRFVPIPFVGAGQVNVTVEYERADTGPRNVFVTRIPENLSGIGLPSVREQVFIGPSTSTKFPLLDITPTGPGMVVVDAEDGLTSNEVSMEVGKAPANTAWELPLLTEQSAFQPPATAYVQNLSKAADGASNVSIFNLGQDDTECSIRVLRPKGTQLDMRTGIVVPARGVKRVDDLLTRAAIGSGVVAAVACDQPFYALGAFPHATRTKVRVNYPLDRFPPAGTKVTMVDSNGTFLNVKQGSSAFRVPLPFELAPGGNGNGTRYRKLVVDFDVRTANPQGFTVIRGIVAMQRPGGRRFRKTLFFSSFDRPGATGGPKMSVDIGTPYIETTV